MCLEKAWWLWFKHYQETTPWRSSGSITRGTCVEDRLDFFLLIPILCLCCANDIMTSSRANTSCRWKWRWWKFWGKTTPWSNWVTSSTYLGREWAWQGSSPGTKTARGRNGCRSRGSSSRTSKGHKKELLTPEPLHWFAALLCLAGQHPATHLY